MLDEALPLLLRFGSDYFQLIPAALYRKYYRRL